MPRAGRNGSKTLTWALRGQGSPSVWEVMGDSSAGLSDATPFSLPNTSPKPGPEASRLEVKQQESGPGLFCSVECRDVGTP